jgi:hypothetical protein
LCYRNAIANSTASGCSANPNPTSIANAFTETNANATAIVKALR